jgi:polysaccharide biosynthesis/export protein
VKLGSTVFSFALLVGWAGGWTVSGQATPEKQPPETVTSTTPPNTEKLPPEGTGVAVDPNKYVIGAEDLLFVKVWREPDFTLPVVVRPDGKITMPLIGELQASNLTPQALTSSIKEQLSKYINNPDVTVFVEQVRSKKYYIQGEVNRTGFFPLVTPTTMLEALGNAGGFREFANSKDIRILRNGKILHFNYKDVSRGKHLEQNIFVENGDQIFVH